MHGSVDVGVALDDRSLVYESTEPVQPETRESLEPCTGVGHLRAKLEDSLTPLLSDLNIRKRGRGILR
jgi:hypothetical protein